MSLEDLLISRSAAVYADFLEPYVTAGNVVLDVGCGSGSITVGLAAKVDRVIGVDLDDAEFVDARTHARRSGIDNVEFREGSVYALDFPDRRFDACLAHSMLETLDRPVDAMREVHRVLKPGGVVGVASVEYGGLILGGPDEPVLRRFYDLRTRLVGGLILGGPDEPVLRRFYDLRTRLWQDEGVADPYRGRALRGVLTSAGFERVAATTTSICHGTDAAVRAFGLDRAEDCRDVWYEEGAERLGIGTAEDLRVMEQAWLAWSESPDAYAAFSWCRAIGFRPAR